MIRVTPDRNDAHSGKEAVSAGQTIISHTQYATISRKLILRLLKKKSETSIQIFLTIQFP